MPKSIQFSRFEKGLNLQQGPSSSDANTLRVLKNAYVTEGKSIRKRPGFQLVATLEAGTTGLFAGKGKLNTFYGGLGTVTHANTLFQAHNIRSSFLPAGLVVDIAYCEVFNNFLYVSARYDFSIFYQQHYLDGAIPGATHIADANCPQSAQVIKISSMIWSINLAGDTVRFCAVNAPRDWTTLNKAGFLPTGLQSTGSAKATALGYYNNRLVVFFADSAQIWQVDVDPAKHQFLQTVDTGTTLPYGHSNMAGDVFFLSPQGVRTITAQENTQSNLIDSDVGSPIDRDLVAGTILVDLTKAKSQYYRGGGQYWLYQGTKAAVYTFSRSNKVSAWSVYEFPFTLDYLDELDGELYARSGNNVYKFSRALKTDNGTLYPVEIELAYLDFKSPGVLKQILSMDAVITGSATIAHRFDARNPSLITDPPIAVSGDSRPGNVFPVELLATNIAPVIKNLDDKDFELHSLSYVFDNLGAV